MRSFAVLGAGSWGSALAKVLAENGCPVVLWSRDVEQVAWMQRERTNPDYLGNARFPASLQYSADLVFAVRLAEVLLIATPSQAFRGLLEEVSADLPRPCKLVWACKGIEAESGKLLHQIAAEVLGGAYHQAVISGPNFSAEIALRIPSATTVASNQVAFAAEIAGCLHNDWFRVYSSEDMVGVQVGGALKNGLAIAAGIADGLKFGANTRAALLTRGIQEIMRLGVAMGGRQETFLGLSGIGDLILTCTDNQSRNRRFGLLLAEGHSRDQALQQIGHVVEGIRSVEAAMKLGEAYQVELPILQEVYRILYEGKKPLDAVRSLLARQKTQE